MWRVALLITFLAVVARSLELENPDQGFVDEDYDAVVIEAQNEKNKEPRQGRQFSFSTGIFRGQFPASTMPLVPVAQTGNYLCFTPSGQMKLCGRHLVVDGQELEFNNQDGQEQDNSQHGLVQDNSQHGLVQDDNPHPNKGDGQEQDSNLLHRTRDHHQASPDQILMLQYLLQKSQPHLKDPQVLDLPIPRHVE